MYPVCRSSWNVEVGRSIPAEAARSAAATARLATPPIFLFVGCHSKSVETTSSEFCKTQLARHSGRSTRRFANTRDTALRIFASYPGTGACTCASVFLWRFRGSNEKQTTPASNVCLAVSAPAAPPSAPPSAPPVVAPSP